MYALKILAVFLAGIFLTALTCGILLLIRIAIQSRPRRPREPGFDFIFVSDDGEARELDGEEKKYLSTKFEFGDGARPYIKSYYESLTPDGRMGGYLRRRQLPKRVRIGPEAVIDFAERKH